MKLLENTVLLIKLSRNVNRVPISHLQALEEPKISDTLAHWRKKKWPRLLFVCIRISCFSRKILEGWISACIYPSKWNHQNEFGKMVLPTRYGAFEQSAPNFCPLWSISDSSDFNKFAHLLSSSSAISLHRINILLSGLAIAGNSS